MKSLIALCMLLGLVSYASAKRQVFTSTHKHNIRPVINGGDDDSDDSDEIDGGPLRRMLLADNVLAGPEDVEGTRVYADGNCVLVRTCFPNPDVDNKLTCTEEHVCEF